MKKLIATAILLIATTSTLAFAQQSNAFAKHNFNLTKNAQDLKEAV